MKKWIVLWSLWMARLVRQPTVPLHISSGLLRGEIAPDGSHARYLAIPYATHPEKRFQAPDPEPIWDGVFEAIDENIRCPQRKGSAFFIGRHDCLVLNVYTPLPQSHLSSLPVMMFIHGGGFYDGSGNSFLYGPDYILDKGVILVTINYRLNLQGFLCLRIKEAPGNAGMKDQVAALKWIKKNIRQFGGDPDNVTIFGESAGSASVSYHLLSPMSKGLFHKAILQSGSALSSWALQFRPIYLAGLMTKVMGYSVQDPYEILDILMQKSDRDLVVTRVPRREGNVVISELLYAPCVEEKLEGVEAFLTELPYDLLIRGEYNKVPVMIGTNDNEGLLFISMENDTIIPSISIEKSLPKNLHIPTETERKEISRVLDSFYVKGEPINRDTIIDLSRFYGDFFIDGPVLEEMQLHLQSNSKPLFSYRFDYSGWRNIVAFGSGRFKNATHADEIFYLFSQKIIPSFFEFEMINKMTTMWTNFAKFGEPTPSPTALLPTKWYPTNKTSPHLFVINAEFTTAPLWGTETLRYFREVYKKYRRK